MMMGVWLASIYDEDGEHIIDTFVFRDADTAAHSIRKSCTPSDDLSMVCSSREITAHIGDKLLCVVEFTPLHDFEIDMQIGK